MTTTSMSRSCVAALLLLGSWSLSQAADYLPGKTYFGRNNYVEYIAGDLPFVISAPHGGREKPSEIPDREKGTFAFDTNTQELIRAIDAEFAARTGHHPHVVICRIQRRKIDVNREIVEACAGNKLAEVTWNEYHRFIDSARASVSAKYGKGLFIDLHGHGHKDQRLELGYLHSRDTLAKSDAELNKPEIIAESGLRALVPHVKMPYAELLRGPRSFGALMEANGFASTPSPKKPVPGDPYFNGGYTVRRHTSTGAPFVGFQIESNSHGVRDNAASRAKFAKALFNSVRDYLGAQFELKLPVAPGSN